MAANETHTIPEEVPLSEADVRKMDHHIQAFSLWMAGAGIKGGTSYGSTDELGYAVVKHGVPVHDLHATMLHQLGSRE